MYLHLRLLVAQEGCPKPHVNHSGTKHNLITNRTRHVGTSEDRNDRRVSREDDPSGVFGYGSTGQPEGGAAGLDEMVGNPGLPRLFCCEQRRGSWPAMIRSENQRRRLQLSGRPDEVDPWSSDDLIGITGRGLLTPIRLFALFINGPSPTRRGPSDG